MPNVAHLKPSDMDLDQLDAQLKLLAKKRAEAPTTTRRLVISTLIDRLLDEKNSRRA